jgi:3alpha(or 20beta)-hydroxysteroid dehydrogenase
MQRLQGQVAIITGAAAGIGAATARLFAAEGASVVLADVADASELASEIGPQSLAVKLDVREPEAWAAAVAETERRFGGLHILVNNAGIMLYKDVLSYTLDELHRVLDINLIGAMLGTQAVAPAIERSGGGAIVNVSSTAGLHAHNGMAAYVASKWGLRGYTKAAAMELSRRGVRVNSVHPGSVLTPLANPDNLPRSTFDARMTDYPIPRMCDPEEIAAAILFLASREASFSTGAELAVDGGMTIGNYFAGLPGEPIK